MADVACQRPSPPSRRASAKRSEGSLPRRGERLGRPGSGAQRSGETRPRRARNGIRHARTQSVRRTGWYPSHFCRDGLGGGERTTRCRKSEQGRPDNAAGDAGGGSPCGRKLACVDELQFRLLRLRPREPRFLLPHKRVPSARPSRSKGTGAPHAAAQVEGLGRAGAEEAHATASPKWLAAAG